MSTRTTCPACKGTGLDKKHQWHDGSRPHCVPCAGYGYLTPPTPRLGYLCEHTAMEPRNRSTENCGCKF